MLICGSFTIGRLFDVIFANFLFNGVLYFSLKNLFCGKSVFFLFFLIKNENPFVGTTYVFARNVTLVMKPRKRFKKILPWICHKFAAYAE